MKKAFSFMVLVFLLIACSSNAMAEKVLKSFNMGAAKTLFVQNLFANVTVKVGNIGVASVAVSGDKKLISDITNRQDVQGNIRVAGKEKIYGLVSIRNNYGYSSVIILGNNSVVAGRDVVIVNGKVIKGGNEKSEPELVNIEIVVPKGTDVNAFHNQQLAISGLNGRLSANLSGQDRLNASQVRSTYLECSGQSECEIFQASGTSRLNVSGQSRILISGTGLSDVKADASGQSEVVITGNCHDFIADASGQSEITLHGCASGRISKNSSGQSDIH